jgi:Uma2 family endonuclease
MTQTPLRQFLTQDQHLVYYDRTWEQFKHIQKGFENLRGVRLFYYDGIVEILMPGQAHEIFASIIGCLLMIYLAQKRIAFTATRSVTQEKEGIASAQADESYCVDGLKPIPDLSIEVVYTSGGISKLTRYQALGVPEVWFWQDGVLTLHHLRSDGYEKINQSELPGLDQLDLDLLKRCIMMAETDQGEAIRTFQQAIS